MSRLVLFVTILFLAPGCETTKDSDVPLSPSDVTDPGTTTDPGSVADPGSPADVPATSAGWTQASTPCPGSKTNALWFDNRLTGYVGCGENASGKGLFVTKDGGLTWTAAPDFDQVRVNDIRRGGDGKLYGAGVHTLDGYSAWLIDETGGSLKPVALFQPGKNAYTKVAQGENLAVTKDVQALVDSLTGTSAAYRPAGGTFTEMSSLGEETLDDPKAGGFQVRRVVDFDNKFYACGSVINEPAQVMVPSKKPGATYHMARIELQPSTRDGELLDMHLWSASRAIVAGHDQSEQYPLVYLGNGDLTVKASWSQVDLKTSGITYKAGVNAVFVLGETVIVACDKIPTQEGGCVWKSTDGGKTWADITPKLEKGTIGPMSAAWAFDNGDIVAAGGGAEMWIYKAK